MREKNFHTDINIDQCWSKLAETAAPWPDCDSAYEDLIAFGLIRYHSRVIGRHDDNRFVLALEKRDRVFSRHRGIGFRLICQLSEEIGCSGTQIICCLNSYLLWRLLVCLAFLCFVAFCSFRIGIICWFFLLPAIFILLVNPADDEAELVSFLKTTLKTSEIKPE